MLVTTHNLIANTVYSTVMEKLEIKLHRRGLKYGCIKPDISPSMRKESHRKENTQDLVYNMIKDIQKQSFPETKKELKDFSIKLGIILHYIADYFCFAHNDSKFCNFFKHFIYEYKLARKFIKVDIRKLCSHSWKIYENSLKQEMSIQEFIEKKHTQYLRQQHKMSQDINFAVEIGITVIFMILTQCLENISYKVA
ncbi:MAG: hypothetical protein PWQ96_2343 [Clostridia bacterium]|nr:hypothetical protein [Clostridia bacterium]